MLELKNVKKYYTVGETVTKALDDVSIGFRQKEFVAILGTSGSGKTTLLNVIGGLDNYDSGDLIINGQSTKAFKDSDWDAYRNNSIGFVFQSYNLISHLGILDNVKLGMTLSGVPKGEKHQKAVNALERVGLKDHLNKKPNQLSGGQMQRVAIARALANDPDILLCDEPTGALDTETSVQIMDLIKELSEEKLVIMVTHNSELAREYASRIVRLSDGKIITDSKAYEEADKANHFQLKKTQMSFLTALNLSFNNLKTKKGRTFLTAFASSIGIISIAIVLSLSTGFQQQINSTQAETVSAFPISMSRVASTQPTNVESPLGTTDGDYPDTSSLLAKEHIHDQVQHINHLDEAYVAYINEIDSSLIQAIGFNRPLKLNLLRQVDGDVQNVDFSNASQTETGVPNAADMTSMLGVSTSVIPNDGQDGHSVLVDNYDILAGEFPETAQDIVLVLDSNNQTNYHALRNLGLTVDPEEKLDFDEILGTAVTLVNNNDFYTKLPTGNFIPNQELDAVYEADSNQDLTITGIVRAKADAKMAILAPGIAYSEDLLTEFIEQNRQSDIVVAQETSDINVLSGEPLEADNREMFLSILGGNAIPTSVMIYPKNYETKDEIITYLDAYNEEKSTEDKIIYSDLAGTMTELTGGLMDATTYVLIAFAGISLVTSMIMIGIITYTSVLERTKEIGVLKALGARKKDITRVFDAETFILGIASGALGVAIAYLATIPINVLLENFSGLKDVAQLNPVHSLVLIVISTLLTVLGGHIPARMAAKKDAAIALRAD